MEAEQSCSLVDKLGDVDIRTITPISPLENTIQTER